MRSLPVFTSTAVALLFALAGCSKFQMPSSVRAFTPVLKQHPLGVIEISAAQGEFQNSETTRVTEARASWMIGEKNGVKYSLIVIGRRSVSELDDGSENAKRLNFDRSYAGAKAQGHKWSVATLLNESRYRIEAQLILPVTKRLTVSPGVRHENRYAMKRKQTTLRVESCYRITNNLCGLAYAEIENEGRGADSVNDRVGLGVRYEF